MPLTNITVAQSILERMHNRRKREFNALRSRFTMCYAVSVKTSVCYVGYNFSELKRDVRATECAETRAAYVAKSYGEQVSDLVFFAMNVNGEMFNACPTCQKWLLPDARGFLKNQSQTWCINTQQICFSSGGVSYPDYPLEEWELINLSKAGEKVISEESQKYFSAEQMQ